MTITLDQAKQLEKRMGERVWDGLLFSRDSITNPMLIVLPNSVGTEIRNLLKVTDSGADEKSDIAHKISELANLHLDMKPLVCNRCGRKFKQLTGCQKLAEPRVGDCCQHCNFGHYVRQQARKRLKC